MRVVIQRVTSARVTINQRVAGQIERGLLVFVGIEPADTADDGEWLSAKLTKLRIFSDEQGQMNQSVIDVAGNILLISQFTLHASTKKGARPSYHQAAAAEHAQPLYERFIGQLATALGRPIATGEFGAEMQVALINDGPVTLIIDSRARE